MTRHDKQKFVSFIYSDTRKVWCYGEFICLKNNQVEIKIINSTIKEWIGTTKLWDAAYAIHGKNSLREYIKSGNFSILGKRIGII